MVVDSKRNCEKAQNPLLLRYHRLMDAFSKSDDERDFYLDRREGFIVFADMDRDEEELASLGKEIKSNADRYCLVPKLTFYETKKIMEGFVNEKVYDIDVKEKLSEIIHSKEARENFLDFIYDHEVELEKWQQYYQERSRVRIIEWLRRNDYAFVFEEDLELAPTIVEKLKQNLFQEKVSKDLTTARQVLVNRSKVYYSSEALNPRPKRGRPPKQVAKVEVELQLTDDIYTIVPSPLRSFLYVPDIASASEVTFSAKYDTVEELKANRRSETGKGNVSSLELITQKLDSLTTLSRKISASGVDVGEEVLPVPKGEKEPPRRLSATSGSSKSRPRRLTTSKGSDKVGGKGPSSSDGKPRRLTKKENS